MLFDLRENPSTVGKRYIRESTRGYLEYVQQNPWP
jgi:hypothetical protein